MTGVVQGGWEFVIAAYSITGAVLVAYTVWTIVRLKELRKHD
jgi:CcmD family protein